jgi:hypothetical protein
MEQPAKAARNSDQNSKMVSNGKGGIYTHKKSIIPLVD